MKDEFLSIASTLKIARDEWLLTEDAAVSSVWDWRRACVWEYARESVQLSSLFEEIHYSTRKALGGASLEETSDYLHHLAGECVATGFASEPPEMVKIKDAAARKTVFNRLKKAHESLRNFDWRILLSPQFPETPWSRADGWQLAENHAVGWLGVAEHWDERFAKKLKQTFFVKRSYRIEKNSPFGGVHIELRYPLLSELGMGLHFNIGCNTSALVAVIFVPKVRLQHCDILSLAQEIVRALVARSGAYDHSAGKNPVLLAFGRTRPEEARIEFDKTEQNILAEVSDDARLADRYEVLFATLLGEYASCKARLLNAALLQVSDVAQDRCELNVPIANTADGIRMLKTLGAYRVRHHMTSEISTHLYESERNRLLTIGYAGPGYRPVFSKWEDFERSVESSRTNFQKLFPHLEDHTMKSDPLAG